MNTDLLLIAVIAGAFTWAFRVLPTRMDFGDIQPEGPLRRFLGATGPAAIATLFVASILPELRGAESLPLPLIAGVGMVLILWVWRRSVVLSTLGGAAAYGAIFALVA